VDSELCDKLREQMFVFDNIGELDDRSIQTMLREVPSERLGIALRGADPRCKDKILKNMSQRASRLLLDDMEARGPVKLSEVEQAQKDILAIVRRLADDGTITLGGAGGEGYL
jgi:flagellar motor switch protein FliG